MKKVRFFSFSSLTRIASLLLMGSGFSASALFADVRIENGSIGGSWEAASIESGIEENRSVGWWGEPITENGVQYAITIPNYDSSVIDIDGGQLDLRRGTLFINNSGSKLLINDGQAFMQSLIMGDNTLVKIKENGKLCVTDSIPIFGNKETLENKLVSENNLRGKGRLIIEKGGAVIFGKDQDTLTLTSDKKTKYTLFTANDEKQYLGVSFLESINHLDESNGFGLAFLPYLNVQLSQEEFNMIKEKANRGYQFEIGWEENYDGTHMDIKGYVSMGGSIWYGEKTQLNYTEDWPTIAQALQDAGVTLPQWALGACPWSNQEEVIAANQEGSPYYNDIQALNTTLSTDPKALDVLFRFGKWKRFLTALDPNSDFSDHYIFTDATPGDAQLLADRFNAIGAVHDAAGHPIGLYALMDYCNWKGEGTSVTEIHNTQHWGLQSVLRNMSAEEINSDGALQAFVDSARRTLVDGRILNTEIEIDRNNAPVPNGKYNPSDDPKKFEKLFIDHVNGYLNWE